MDIEMDIPEVARDPAGSMRKVWWHTANALRQLLIERIENGEMPDGGPFLDGAIDRYAESYEKTKQRRGRYPYTPGDRFVLTGEMMANFDIIESDEDGATLGFHTAETGERAMHNYQLRPVMDFTDEDFDAAFEAAKQEVE